MNKLHVKKGDEVVERLQKMVALAREYGVTLCHENEAKIYGESPEKCLELVEYFDGKLKCVFDMGNFVLGGYKPYPDAYKLLSPYVDYFHIKDVIFETGELVPAGYGDGAR